MNTKFKKKLNFYSAENLFLIFILSGLISSTFLLVDIPSNLLGKIGILMIAFAITSILLVVRLVQFSKQPQIIEITDSAILLDNKKYELSELELCDIVPKQDVFEFYLEKNRLPILASKFDYQLISSENMLNQHPVIVHLHTGEYSLNKGKLHRG